MLDVPLPPFILPMEDASDVPQLQPQSMPQSKTKDRPYAEPQAPSVPNIPTAPPAKPGDITKPESKVEPQAKPKADTAPPPADISKLPQPYTPDVPPGQTEPPPKGFDPRLIPPIIVGGTALAKLTLDKLSEVEKAELQKAGHTLPSLLPDPNRMPEGGAEKVIPNPVRADEIRQNEDIQLQNLSAETLSKAGYKVKQRHNTPISAEEVRSNPLLKVGKQPDYEIEGRIFDHVAPQKETSVRNLITRNIQRDKIDKGQATRFVINLDKSEITFDQLKEQLEKYQVGELDEIIVIKNGEITPFYQFN